MRRAKMDDQQWSSIFINRFLIFTRQRIIPHPKRNKMKAKIFTHMLVAMCLVNFAFAQPVYIKNIAGVGTLKSVSLLPGNGFLLGAADLYSSSTNMTMVKTDDNGTVQWSKSYGDAVVSYEEATDAFRALDQNYLLLGSNPYTTGLVHAVKTDTMGNMLWHNSYRLVSTTNTTQSVNDYAELADSSVVLAGYAGNSAMLLKIDVNGNILWARNFSGAGNTTITKILKVPGGDFLVTGAANNQFYIARIDAAGNVIWAKSYSTMGTSGLNSCATTNGNYVFTGSTATGMSVIKIDPNGNMLWGKTYNTGTAYSCMVAEQNNGDLFFCYFASGINVLKTDSLGNLPVCKRTSNGNITTGRNLRQTIDGGYVFVSGNHLTKVNASPALCSSTNQAITPTSVTPVAAALTFSVNTYAALVPKNIFSFTINTSTQSVCGGKCTAADNFGTAMYFPDTVCRGAAVTLTSSTSWISGTPTYTWYENGIPFSTAPIPTRNFNVPGSYVITMIVKSPASCRDTTVKTIYVRSDCGTDGSQVSYFNKTITNFANPNDIVQTPDSGFVVVGSSNVGGYNDVCIVKTDSGGNVLWGKTYGASGVNEVGRFVRTMPDKGLLIAGDDNYIFVVRTDSAGNVLWENSYKPTTTITTTSSILEDVAVTSDSGIVYVGFQSGNAGMLFKTDKNGNIVWVRHKASSYFSASCPMPNNEVLVGGVYLGNDVCLLRLDGAGNVVFAKNYPGMNFDDIYDIIPVSDGNYMVLVNRNTGNPLLMKIDPDGNVIWTTDEDILSTVDGTNTSICEDPDNGFELVMHSSSSMGLSLLKTDELGYDINITYNTGSAVLTPVIRTFDSACVFMEGSTFHKFTAMHTIQQCVNTNIASSHTAIPPTATVAINPATTTYCIVTPQAYPANPSTHLNTTICTNIGCNADASFNASIFACLNQPVSFTNTSIGGTGFIWKVNNVQFANTVNASYTFTTAGTYAIKLELTDSSGCTDNFTLNIVASAMPSVSYTQSPSSFCATTTAVTLSPATPAGGFYSGPGVVGNVFYPAIVGPGTYSIIYTYTSAGGCPNSDTVQVTVTTPSAVAYTQLPDTFCTNSPVITLSPGTPSGGVYSGPGVSGNTFNPAIAGPGNHIITYTAGGCSASATDQVTVIAPPAVSYVQSPSSLCVASAVITLSPGIPSGGVYSGPGVSGNTFDPASVGVGTYTITYSYTSGSCTNAVTSQITVTAVPVVSFSQSPSSFCTNSAVVNLSPATPSGGTYSGPGVSGNTFDPASAGAGTFTLTYTYSSGGCTVSDTAQVSVLTTPVVSYSQSPSTFCSNGSVVTLAAGSPAGGTYSGPGVSGNTFDPFIAGAGFHTITYTYNSGGCINSAADQVTVTAAPSTSFTQVPAAFCPNSSPVTLSPAMPSGGTYSGPGVSGTTFDPASVGVGVYAIVYTYTDANGCTDSDTSQITVSTIPAVSYVQSPAGFCTNSAPVILSAAIPAGGIYSGPGVSGNTFDPASVGAGTYTIVYTYTISGGCTNSDSAQVTVSTSPTVSYVQSPSNFCDNSPVVTLTAGSPAGGVYSGTAVSGNTFDPVSAGAGTYAIVYTYFSSGCPDADTSQVIVSVCTGIQNADVIHSTEIFPNPSSGIFTVHSTAVNGEIEIYDVLGKRIFAAGFTNSIMVIDLSEKSDGIYFVNVKTEAGSFSQKIIINH
jgi:hypothetical protein